MSEVTDQLSEMQAKLLELLEQIQAPVVTIVRDAAEWAGSVVPEVKVPNLDRVGTADELVDVGFGFLDAVLDNQKAFVGELLDAATPVRAKIVDADAKPVKPVRSATAKKAA